MLVASGQGESAVSNPNKKAVRTGVVLLSNNVCNQFINPSYLSICLMVLIISALNLSGDVLAFPKAKAVMSFDVSLPFLCFTINKDDQVTLYFSAIA